MRVFRLMITKYKVPFVDFGESYQEIRKKVLKEIDRVLSAGDLILRNDVEKFEQNLADYVGTKYAVGVNSGTDALFLSLKALGIGPGDEVITSGYTFWATVEAIINCGATPVLADIGNDLLIDFIDIEKHITERTKAIIPVYIGGTMCNMYKILDIALRFNLQVIEDAAQALGAELFEKKAGRISTIGCFSFYPAKVLGCYGDGGAITTDSKKLADKIRLLRNHGGKPHPQFVGYNSRLDNLQAAILNIKLKQLPELIERRNRIAKIYDTTLPFSYRPVSQTYQEYNFRVDKRDELHKFLTENGIETIKGDYTFPIEVPENCKKANKEIIRLPVWPTLTDEQIKYVCKKIKEFYKD